MSRAKLAAAKELIEAQQYDAARAVLKTMRGDDTAKAWLKNLPKKKRGWWKAASVAFVFFAGVGIGSSGTRSMLERTAVPTRAVLAVPTEPPTVAVDVSRIDDTSTSVPPSETSRPTDTPTVTPSLTITPTVFMTPSATDRSLIDRILGRGGPTEVPSITPIPPTLNETILQTQAFFTDQQTQAAAGVAVAQASMPTTTLVVQSLGGELPLYAMGSVNVRACPSRECEIIGSLADRQRVIAIGIVSGEQVERLNTAWYVVQYGGREAFVYSGFVNQQYPTEPPARVSTRPPPPTSVPIVSPYTCNGIDDLNCSDFPRDGRSAQAHLLMCGNEDRLDGDGDGRACEFTGW